MITIEDKSKCCGCNACGDVCPKDAITFDTDIEGFAYPNINHDKCIDCHLCEKVCPILQIDRLKVNDLDNPICFAAQCKNLQSLFNSTSGSAFATLAEKMYKMGGYVGGAIFNDDYSVSQFISSDKGDLDKLRNSKYVQSDSQGFYKQVMDLLVAGEKVLVCGLPCQMAGLRSFLRKDYENLIILDLICLGINSPKILRGYLDYMEEKHNSKIVYYKAKNKELGWRQLTTKIVFENGDVEYDKKDTNYFTHGFIGTHAYARPSCYDCKFKGFPRVADITIGDLWGAERIVGKEYDCDLGTSVILVNSKKGQDYYQSVLSSFKTKEISLDEVIKGNPALMVPTAKPLIDREAFYRDLSNMRFIDFARKYIKIPSESKLTIKTVVKNLIRFAYHTAMASGINPLMWVKNLYYNIICSRIKTNISKGQFITIQKHCVINIAKRGKVEIYGPVNFGYKRVKGSHLESRLLVDDGGKLVLKGCSIAYGADIEVFSDSCLEIGSNNVYNMGTTIICGNHITIDDDVSFGRNVTVRDNNGGHFMSRRMYKDKRTVKIGQHSWLTEQVTVMPGANIGVGVIVGARSVVSGKLPNFTLATGSPAEVVDEEIYWKR